MSSRVRSKEEVEQALRDQVDALESSCAAFDNGKLWEGPRIATVIYTLVNDGRSKSVSILSQLGIRGKILFISYATPKSKGNLLSWLPLCMLELGDGPTRYVPALSNGPYAPRKMHFQKWWEEQIFENRQGQKLSRMNLVFALRSQDGGSHFDPELPITPYLELKEQGAGFTASSTITSEQDKLIPNAHLVTLRHIAFELQESLSSFLQSNG